MAAEQAWNSEQLGSVSSKLEKSIQDARRKLLDLGLRNNLLNFRIRKVRDVEIVDADLDDVYEKLVANTRKLRFAPKPVDAELEDDDASRNPQSQTPWNRLLSEVEPPELHKRLLNTHNAARTTLEEQGVNTLFLAFGSLIWFDSDQSQRVRRAPLVLVPVELNRHRAEDDFELSYSGEEIGSNLSLIAKMRHDFGIEIPPFSDEDQTITEYLDQVARLVSPRAEWAVRYDQLALGQFSFQKFLMYSDLDPENWPPDAKPYSNPILAALLKYEGFRSQPSKFNEDTMIDEVVDDAEFPMVVDADSTQTLALLDALNGRTMVIQGPPGTGKSQTITNLIALALHKGLKVLFVAEKMAALEVVKLRLDRLGLGEACLELHGTKTRKSRVLAELAKTLDRETPSGSGNDAMRTRLQTQRSWLNRYCEAISSPVHDSGVTAYRALGEIAKRRITHAVDGWPTVRLETAPDWDVKGFHSRELLVGQLQELCNRIGNPAVHPFRGVKRTDVSPIEQDEIRRVLREAIDAIATLQDLNARTWAMLEAKPLTTPAAIDTVIATGKRARQVEAQGKIAYADPAWSSQADAVPPLLDRVRRAQEVIASVTDQVSEKAWTSDLEPVIDALTPYRESYFRWIWPAYHHWRSELDQYLTDAAPADLGERIDLLVNLRTVQKLTQEIDAQESLGIQLFGDDWQGVDSDVDELEARFLSATSLRQDIVDNGLASSLLTAIDGGADLTALANVADQLSDTKTMTENKTRILYDLLEFDPEAQTNEMMIGEHWPIKRTARLLKDWDEGFHHFSEWIWFLRTIERCRAEGLGSIADLALSWDRAGTELLDLFQYRYYLELLDVAWRKHGILGESGNTDKQFRLQEFSTLDIEQFNWNRARLAKAHWEHLPAAGPEMPILHKEFQKRRRHIPIRMLIQRAGRAIQSIKPVFMMSPLSIANFIPPGSLQFDLVIFDEASQVSPVDAFGAILRGKQVIVVGDDRQLPPTSFFDKMMGEADDEEIDVEDVDVGDMQSILNLFLAQNAPQRMLRWHYRSQHESLIAVSNREFYNNNLVIFPSPMRDQDDLGLRFHHLPDTVYDRGRSRKNVLEARAVADAVMNHARQTPKLTLGVAAFSSAQADAIRDELEILRRQNPDLEKFFENNESEPFFVKPLEHVQGDERDVIFISIGYGRDETGRMTKNFGPLNKDGGERRLNVLITRSRRRCEVFANFTDEDVSLSSTSAGVRALRTFLHFARTREFSETEPGPTGEPQSPFEEAVLMALENAGHTVHCQVGVAGYFIDLAVVDPEHPGRYLLGIECDGATYHSARSARDRDRLRQQVLERLGWTIHRIWSTDWFTQRNEELLRALEAIEKSRACKRVSIDSGVLTEVEAGSSDKQAASCVSEAVVPTTIEEATVSDSSEKGVSGQGSSVPRSVGQPNQPHAAATNSSKSQELHPPRPDFTHSGDLAALPPYQIANLTLPQVSTKFTEIEASAIERAIREVVRVESPIHIDLLARRITNACGLRRTGKRIRQRILRIAHQLESRGVLKIRNEIIWASDMKEPPLRSWSNLQPSDRKFEYIAPEEIDGVIVETLRQIPSILELHLVEIAVRSLGWQRSRSTVVNAVQQRLDALREAKVIDSWSSTVQLATSRDGRALFAE